MLTYFHRAQAGERPPGEAFCRRREAGRQQGWRVVCASVKPKNPRGKIVLAIPGWVSGQSQQGGWCDMRQSVVREHVNVSASSPCCFVFCGRPSLSFTITWEESTSVTPRPPHTCRNARGAMNHLSQSVRILLNKYTHRGCNMPGIVLRF